MINVAVILVAIVLLFIRYGVRRKVAWHSQCVECCR